MTEPRGIDDRIAWFLNNRPSGPGMCAQHSWHSLGGNNGSVPAWNCDNANEVYDKVKKSGRYWTGKPKRGALVLWRYGNNGHAAICYDEAGTKIVTTNPDPDNSSGTATGIESIDYPSKWGGSSSSRIYTDEYNGVRFPIGDSDEEDDVKHVFLALYTDKIFGKGSAITFDQENVDEGGFHAPDMAAVTAPWSCVGSFYIEAIGGEVEFLKYDKNNELIGDVGRSSNGNLMLLGNLGKGECYRVSVVEGTVTSATLKADIRER